MSRCGTTAPDYRPRLPNALRAMWLSRSPAFAQALLPVVGEPEMRWIPVMVNG